MTKQLIPANENKDIITFDDDKVGLIKRTIAKDATDDELSLFLHQAQRTGLDPLARQIYFQKYNTRNGPQIAIITGIDGYRLVASRTGAYAGNDAPVFDGRQTYAGKDVPVKVTVTVWRIVSGNRMPFAASVYWNEYCPDPPRDYQWKKMPHVMLAKCAEAAALRKAFPADLSGVYTHEEMQQADFVEISQGVIVDEGNQPDESKLAPPDDYKVNTPQGDELKPKQEAVKGHDMTAPNAETVAMWRGKVENGHRLKALTVAGMVANAVPYFDNDYHALQYTDFDKDATFADMQPALDMFDALVKIGTEKASE